MKTTQPSRDPRAGSSTGAGFTVIELLAVVVIILLLVGTLSGVFHYAYLRSQIVKTKAQLAMLAVCLDAYKADWGHYPQTSPWRLSASGWAELDNNRALFRGLINGNKNYLKFKAGLIRTNKTWNLVDEWDMPFVYYCSPATSYAVSNIAGFASYTLGGQVNVATYDLLSYGPDRHTYVPGAVIIGSSSWSLFETSPNSAIDDITERGR